MKTIVQTIGPLYGDNVNGTVFGQPNGSVYTPPVNSITPLQAVLLADKVASYSGDYVSTSTGLSPIVALDFDVKCAVDWLAISELATDSSFTTIVSSGNARFLNGARLFKFGKAADYSVVPGTTYYARIRIIDTNGGNTLLTTSTYTLTGVTV